MLKCKVCGAANSPDSSVCAECGAKLRPRRKYSADSNKEIFSDTKSEELVKSGEQRDLFSSGEKYEKVRKGAVLEKIYEQERAMGEVPDVTVENETVTVKPIVINRQSSSDIVKSSGRYSSENGKAKAAASKNHRIPQRIIEPSDAQIIGHKIKAEKNGDENSDEKVELKPSNVIEDIHKKGNRQSEERKKRETENPSGRSSEKSRDKKSLKTSDGEKKPHSEKKEDYNKNPDKASSGTGRSVQKPEAKKKINSLEEESGISQKPERKKKVSSISSEFSEMNRKNVKITEDKADKKKRSVPQKSEKKKRSAPGNTPEKPAAKKKSRPHDKVSENYAEAAVSGQEKQKFAESKTQKDSIISEKKDNVKSSSPKKSLKKQEVKTAVGSRTEGIPSRREIPSVQGRSASDKNRTKPKKTGNRSFSEDDVEKNKNIAALAYIGILFLIPLFKIKKSDFCKAHIKQGAAVFIYSLIVSMVTLIAVVGLRILLVWQLKLSFFIYNIASIFFALLMLILILIPVFSGASAAFGGNYRSVPFVGKFVNKKK